MFLLIVGTVLLASGIALALRNWRRRKTWRPAQAITQVRGEETSRFVGGTTNVVEHVRFRFADANGRWHSFDVRDRPGFRKHGETVLVFHDPDNPENAMLATARDMYGWACGVSLLGGIGMLFGCLMLFA